MIEVAIVSLEQALEANGAEIPAGSAAFARRPMNAAMLGEAGKPSRRGSRGRPGARGSGHAELRSHSPSQLRRSSPSSEATRQVSSEGADS